MSTNEAITRQYATEVARQQTADTVPTGRWIVQRWDERKGVYRDELATDSAVFAEHGFRQSKEHRVVDPKINEVAADYPRTSYAQERGEAEYSSRSQFRMALDLEQSGHSRNPSPNAAPDRAVADAFLNATTPEQRRTASERHPQLVAAFALEASYARLAQNIEGRAGQEAFQSRMRENIAADIAQGRTMAEVRLCESPVRSTALEHDRGR